MKLGVNRLLNKGFQLNYSYSKFSISSWFFNIILMNASFFSRGLNLGYMILYFLKPSDNEQVLKEQLKKFFGSVSINNCIM